MNLQHRRAEDALHFVGIAWARRTVDECGQSTPLATCVGCLAGTLGLLVAEKRAVDTAPVRSSISVRGDRRIGQSWIECLGRS